MFSYFVRILRPVTGAVAVLAMIAPAVPAQTSQTSSTIVANRITQAVDDSSRTTLHGYVHPLANAANDRGAAPDSMQLNRMHLLLRRSDSQEAALRQLIAEMHTPGTASYHQWLTPDQFGQQFGPSDQDVATVESWLSSHGFAVAGVEPGKQVIEFSGNVAQMRDAFHAQIHKYVVSGNTHYATATEPDIPSALAPVVSGFVALNDFSPKKQSRVLGQASFDPKTHTATPNWTYGSGPSFVVSPADFAVQYDLNPLYSANINGSGQTIAIINDSNINVDMVNQFRTLFSLPANAPTVIVDGNDPGIDGINNPDGPNYDSSEAYIDVEWSGAVAPQANVDLVIAADTALESGLFLAAEHAVYGNIAPIMSISFGQCEAALGSSNEALEQLMEQAAAQGITVMVSAGDSGSAGCDSDTQEYAVDGVAVNGFASTPWNVALGGTDFYYSDYASGGASRSNYWSTTPTTTPQASINGYIEEQPWNDSQFGLDSLNYYNLTGGTTIAGGSGGASSAALCVSGTNTEAWSTSGSCAVPPTGYAKPSWQTGTGVPADKVRDLPDVSLFAADGTNYSYYAFCWEDGDCQSSGTPIQISGAGGTSFASPTFAGIMALVNQYQTQKLGTPQRQGQADFVLYPLKAQYPQAFHDVTVGSNAEPCAFTTVSSSSGTIAPLDCLSVPNGLKVTDPTYGAATEGELGLNGTPAYNAAAGYNLATGLGTIDANQLVTDWGSVKFQTSTTTLTASSASFTHGTAITINGTVTGTGTPTGSVALMTDSTTPLQAGQAVFPLSGGSYSSSNVTYLPGGTYNIWGQYSGDGTNGPSTSGKTQITVTPEASTDQFAVLNSSGASVISSGATVPYGTQLILSSHIYGSTFYTDCVAGAGTNSICQAYTSPTGTVTFADNGTTVNTAVINVEGDAEYNGPFSIGTHSITSNFAGDASYNSSSSSAFTFTVAQAQPGIFVGASNQSNGSSTINVVGGQSTILYVGVEGSGTTSTTASGIFATTVLPPTGTVTVTGLPSGTTSGAVTLVAGVDGSSGMPDGVAAITIPASASAGNYNLSISYSGDANYAALSGETGTLTIGSAAGASTTITASSTGSVSPTTSITVTGSVTGNSSKGAPTGAIYVYGSGNYLTTFYFGATSGDVSNFTGVLNSQTLAQGGNVITLQYSGDNNYNGSAMVLSGTIQNSLADFSMTANPAVTVPASGSGTDTVFVTPVNSFSGTVSLGCAVQGSPTGVSCSLSQSSVALTYSQTAKLPEHDRRTLFETGGGALLACVLLLTIPARRRAWRNMLTLVLFACIVGFGVGCGGSSGPANLGGSGSTGGSGGSGGTTSAGTVANPSQSVTLTVTAASGAAAGTYTVAITGTSASSGQAHTLGVTATVQ